MDAFQNNNLIIINTQIISFEFPFSGTEIETRQFYFLSLQQCGELLIEEFQIECIQGFVIVLSFVVKRSTFSVYKVVIQ